MSKPAKSKPKYGFLRIVGRLSNIYIKALPFGYIMFFVGSATDAVFYGLQTVMTQRFFDAATGMAQGSTDISTLVWALALMGLTIVLFQALDGRVSLHGSVMHRRLTGVFTDMIHQKAARLDPLTFEDPAQLDHINKADAGAKAGPRALGTFNMIFSFCIPYFVFMGGYLYSLQPSLALAIAVVFIPTAISQIIRTRAFALAEDQSAQKRRAYEYYEGCIAGRELFKETRLLGGFLYFKNLYMDALMSAQRIAFKATVRSNLFELIASLLTVAGYALIAFMLFTAMMNRQISVGAFAAVLNSVGMLYGLMDDIMRRHFGAVAQNLGAVRNFINFLDLPERKDGKEKNAPAWGDIELKNVSFSYPNADAKALDAVSLTLRKGETLAIVGENGSGKSTLIRLITGLYQPTEGKVIYGGRDASEFAMAALQKNTSAVFQKYQRYQMKLNENITISATDKERTRDRLDKVGEMAGIDAGDSAFPEGYDTMLSREFDGVDLSGGQWQRIAIARGFYREYNLIILDEPTAAIDPYEEARIYNRFAQIVKDKSAVIVTHRIGSVKLADRIAVLKDGKVVQTGTHDELMADQQGEYKRLYEAQKQWYGRQPVSAGSADQ